MPSPDMHMDEGGAYYHWVILMLPEDTHAARAGNDDTAFMSPRGNTRLLQSVLRRNNPPTPAKARTTSWLLVSPGGLEV